MEHEDLIEALSDPDPDVRRDASEQIALEMDDELASGVLDVVSGTSSEEIRAGAIIILGPLIEECGDEYDEHFAAEEDDLFGPPVSAETFRTLVKRIRAIYDDESQPKLLRRRAFEVLVRDPHPWQTDEIRKQLASPDEEWRLTALFAMGWVAGFDDELLDAVRNGTGVHLAEAVRAAGQMEVMEAAPILRDLVVSDETERDLRLEAILALPHVDPDSYEMLQKLTRSKDEDVAAIAREALDNLMAHGDPDD